MDRERRRGHLAHLFREQDGLCKICGEFAVLDGMGGETNRPESAVRFRTGSSFGAKGRRRPRVMAHRKCADRRAKEIELSVPIEELWARSGSEPSAYYEIKKGENQMGREVRMVPPGWQHPKDSRGHYIPLMKGPFSTRLADWIEAEQHWNAGDVADWSKHPEKAWKPIPAGSEGDTFEEWEGPRPLERDYMPEFAAGTATHFCMYEDTSEGTPISPPLPTPEALAMWLSDNQSSAFGGMTATYAQWLATIKEGSAPSAVIVGGKMMSGVEFTGDNQR